MDESTPKERRAVSRVLRDTPESVQVRLKGEGCDVVAMVRDVSVSGMGILTQHQFEPGTWLVVEPANPGRHFSPELRAEVLHSTKNNTEGYLVGCRFSRLLTFEDVPVFG